ncbi:winged helix-turn-helix domain-containing protein [Haloprofundus marisrubri]|uniref:winged helix-turn-helix domain-containing protein n=1 Tax=Haloprofundus marisrubri TaxID=1514971 RepID=UPI0009E410E2|nr:winged helix-turn-helix domain-containing protein [Haloprofundus marisrubri]
MADPGDEPHEDTYAVLTDETRIRILLALADHYTDAWTAEWPTFSQLREKVGIKDTSRFSYHLTELQDQFVRKIDGQYRPRVAALKIASAIRAGTYTDTSVKIKEQQTDYQCPHCDDTLLATYKDHHLYVGCPTHGAAVAYPLPPRAATDRPLSDIIKITLQKHACDVRLFRNGVCPQCWGTAGISYPGESIPDSYLLDDVPYATVACDACWLTYPLPVAHTVLGHPAIETLYIDHGLDPIDAQLGPHDLARASDVEYLDSDYSSLELTVELEDDSLVFDLDECCRVRQYRS